ncbi:NUDIX hydrolase [Acetobacter sp. DsW_059]|uniref:NUDIX domain-containing protein n=1 Tax=Acetobacter sp. DsW_059 TaxID=1670661 RepID=UPI000A36241B|nr:NUDIX hydrolase [Acetobacter sp. DsW_059]OUJ10618.1 ADP-ribose pyrophosphatase [Acetobacter sp. DsW_059]
MTAPLPDPGGYSVLSSRIAYENPWTRVREDIIRRPDGKDGLYGVVERGQFAVICPLGRTKDGKPTLTLVNQYRYPVGERLWEFPMGMWETRPDAKPEDLAAGELKEETGLIAGRMLYAGPVYQGAGYSTQKGHIYLATELSQDVAEREQTEQDMLCTTLPLEKFEDMISNNEILCMVTLAAFGLIKAKKLI